MDTGAASGHAPGASLCRMGSRSHKLSAAGSHPGKAMLQPVLGSMHARPHDQGAPFCAAPQCRQGQLRPGQAGPDPQRVWLQTGAWTGCSDLRMICTCSMGKCLAGLRQGLTAQAQSASVRGAQGTWPVVGSPRQPGWRAHAGAAHHASGQRAEALPCPHTAGEVPSESAGACRGPATGDAGENDRS